MLDAIILSILSPDSYSTEFQMIVEEMNILSTVFLRGDNQKIVYPNSTLATRPIGNFYRSPDMGDSVEFLIHIATPAEKIAIIKQRIMRYAKAFSRYCFCALLLFFFHYYIFI